LVGTPLDLASSRRSSAGDAPPQRLDIPVDGPRCARQSRGNGRPVLDRLGRHQVVDGAQRLQRAREDIEVAVVGTDRRELVLQREALPQGRDGHPVDRINRRRVVERRQGPATLLCPGGVAGG
jgi:hypothetical protein